MVCYNLFAFSGGYTGQDNLFGASTIGISMVTWETQKEFILGNSEFQSEKLIWLLIY